MGLNEKVASNVRGLMSSSSPVLRTADLAEVLGCSLHTAGRKLKGKSEWTSTEMGKVAEWLGVMPSSLMLNLKTEVMAA